MHAARKSHMDFYIDIGAMGHKGGWIGKVQVTSCQLQVVSYELQVTSCKLRVAPVLRLVS